MRTALALLVALSFCAVAVAEPIKTAPAAAPAVAAPATAPAPAVKGTPVVVTKKAAVTVAPAQDAAALPATLPAVAPAPLPVVPGEPATAGDALEAGKKAVDFAKAKNWLGFSALAILVLVWILKSVVGKFIDSKRWLYITVPLLGVAAMLLSAFAGGVSWENAWLVLSSAPVAALASDFVKRGILNK